jgi:small subunit ribosomal protein S24e
MAIEEIKIDNDLNNKLLKRREITVSMDYKGATPSREEIKKGVAEKLNVVKDHLVIVRVKTLFGTNKAEVLIHQYADKEAMGIAQKHTITRPNKSKKAMATVSANAEEPAAKK